MTLQMTELLIQTSSAGKHTHVRVTHIPTGLMAEASGEGYIRIREQALNALEEEIEESKRNV
jgi:protein subunit release factor A